MFAYQTPGVYFEWQDNSIRPPAVLRTDIAGFVGIAERGPLHRAVRVESWTQFVSQFGRHVPQAYLAYGVEGFFTNGGSQAWIVRVADPASARKASLVLLDDEGRQTLEIAARWEGRWAHALVVTVLRTSRERFALILRLANGGQEIWSDLSMHREDERYAPRLLNDEDTGSAWVRLVDRFNGDFPANTPDASATNLSLGSARLQGGADGLASLQPGHFSGEAGKPASCMGLACLDGIDEIGLVAMPDIMPKPRVEPRYGTTHSDCRQLEPEPEPPVPREPPQEFAPAFSLDDIGRLQQQLVAHCENHGDRFAILDMPITESSPDAALAWRRRFDTSYGAIYYPWIEVSDPLALTGIVRTLPPSAVLAGVFAREDRATGVHKAPANAVLEGVTGIDRDMDDRLHGRFNAAGINVIRPLAGRGIRVMGARTLSSDTSLRYINVRRLLMMITEALDERAQALVFEPNDTGLWRNIERVIAAFLEQIWRAGMLDGATAEDAWFVRCDAETNPPEERQLGRVTALVGIRAARPAEFVVVRIGFTESGASLLEGGS